MQKLNQIKANKAYDMVTSTLDIKSLVEEYGFDNYGFANYQCVFHDDSVPSFRVDFNKNIFKCFGACQRGGNYINLYMYLRNDIDQVKPELTYYTALDEIIRKKDLRQRLGFNSIFEKDNGRETIIEVKSLSDLKSFSVNRKYSTIYGDALKTIKKTDDIERFADELGVKQMIKEGRISLGRDIL